MVCEGRIRILDEAEMCAKRLQRWVSEANVVATIATSTRYNDPNYVFDLDSLEIAVIIVGTARQSATLLLP